MEPIVALALSYLSGSIPFAAIAGKLRGVDLRKQGSWQPRRDQRLPRPRVEDRSGGVPRDALKGALPVLYLPLRIAGAHDPIVWAIACGIAAIAGHVRPIFLKFRRGGKGVATAAGVFFALAPLPMAVTFAVFVAVVFATGYVSLGSMLSAIVLPSILLVTLGPRSPLFLVSTVIALFVFWTHRSNIGRLRRGEEHRFGKRGSA
jgi:glycerol-3-phosphate acyltransferase PlsY